MAKQQVIITLTIDGEEMKTNISFKPCIAGKNSEEIDSMSEEQKTLQAYAEHICCAVIDSIQS